MPYGGYSGSSGESNSGSGYDNAGGVYSTSGVTSNLSYPSRPGIRSSLVSASDMSGIVMVSSTEPSISGASGIWQPCVFVFYVVSGAISICCARCDGCGDICPETCAREVDA